MPGTRAADCGIGRKRCRNAVPPRSGTKKALPTSIPSSATPSPTPLPSPATPSYLKVGIMGLHRLLQKVALLCLVTGGAHGDSTDQYKASVFSGLTPDEMTSVKDFLMDQPELQLGSGPNSIATNLIFMIELNVPKKSDVLNFLDANGPKPRREAKAVIFFGNQNNPNVTEYVVGPLPGPNYYTPIHHKGKNGIRFEARPVSRAESLQIGKTLQEATKEISHILLELTGFSFYNCSDRCLAFADLAPRGSRSGDRRSWIMTYRKVEGLFLHPSGFEILLNHHSLNPQEWKVEKIWYNGQYFDGIEEFLQKYERNEVTKAPLPELTEKDIYSTYKPRGEFKRKADNHGPKICEPQGKRYKVMGNYVEYTGWSFAFRVRQSAGLQLFDIKYNDERIAYEVSLQEAISFYSGVSPSAIQSQYFDSGWAMGTVHYELAKGIDCPDVATYLDLYSFYNNDEPVRNKNALCIFELPTGIPLRRHFDSTQDGGYNFYAGVENHVLVVRTTSTVFNYDYIWDFIFYQNGVMEVKVSATGYIQTSFFTPEGLNYGSRVQTHVIGSLHTHLANYKVDLDVAGTQNSFETVDVRYETVPNPWSPGDEIVQSRLERDPRGSEREAAFSINSALPRYLLFRNPNKKNKWGHERSYRIQYNSHAGSVLPRGEGAERAAAWARYSLAVTKNRDSEQSSSSIFNQNDPWSPHTDFQDFLQNDEDIVSQDLVGWVTVGFLHIPHSEDIPNTSTPGNQIGFFLRPFNFYDEDLSVASRSSVIVRPPDDTFPGGQVQRWIPEAGDFCVRQPPFLYNGTPLPV